MAILTFSIKQKWLDWTLIRIFASNFDRLAVASSSKSPWVAGITAEAALCRVGLAHANPGIARSYGAL
jgi:hypothetical protein